MSETSAMPPLTEPEVKRTATVYFIDDSATMREVIKIAFRRESINIIACADAASALGQFEQNPPDVVITDVIMPDQDGYSVCSQIKQSPQYGKTPVILMSGVVNKGVADRAVSVQADELVRKPFQPQELIGRVKNLLGQGSTAGSPSGGEARPVTGTPLSSLFPPSPVAAAVPPPSRVTPIAMAPAPVTPPAATDANSSEGAWPRALVEAFTPPANPSVPQNGTPVAPRAASSADIQRLRGEIARLELLVKKLQTELQIERQYNQALDQHVKNLTQID